MGKYIILLITFLLGFSLSSSSFSQTKYSKWQTPGYFRGYNVLYENPKTQKDFIMFRFYGGNLFQIGTKGFIGEDFPFDTVQQNIDGTDLLVSYCRNAGIYYTISVRSGPGAYDTYEESSGIKGESTIWNSPEQNTLYANMLKFIAERYKDDTLFAGLNMMVEPRPKVRSIPANTSAMYKFFLENFFNIHMDESIQEWIQYVRLADTSLPLIVQSFAYSTPELFPPYFVSDNYLIYEAHMYQPNEYTKAQTSYSQNYPGVYWNLTTLSQMRFDGDFIRNIIYGKVREFQQTTNYPIILGEAGMMLPQNGGAQFIADMLQPCLDWGWHFALWDWRRSSAQNWNIEMFQGDNHAHWLEVLKRFNAPPAPMLYVPVNNASNVSLNPEFSWDRLTDYTQYDIELYDGNNLVASDSNLSENSYQFSSSLQGNKTYQWHVRSNNPDGPDGEWSEFYTFTTTMLTGQNSNQNIPKEFKLFDNYPNPFNPSTVIRFQLAANSLTKLIVYDLLSREVQTIVNENLNAGTYEVKFDAKNLSSGIYFYKMTTESFTSVKRMMLIK